MKTALFRARKPLSANPTLNLAGAGIAIIAVCYGLARFGYGFFIPIFRTEFNLSPAVIGLFASASYISYCIAIIAATVLTAAVGARTLVITSGILAAASMAGIAIAPNAGALGLAVCATGFCTGLVSPPMATVIAENVASKYQNRVQTMVNSGAGVGVVISVPVALMAASQWRLAWLFFAVLALATTAWIARSAPRRATDFQAPRQHPRGGLMERMFPKPLFPTGSARLLAASALLGASSTSMLTFGRDFMITAGQHTSGVTTMAWVFLGASGLVGSAAGMLTSRYGLVRCWAIGCLSIGGATLLLVVFPGNAMSAIASMALFGAAYTTTSGFLLIWGTEVYRHAPSMGVGMSFLVIALGQAAATPLLGVLMTSMGAVAPFVVAALCGIAACWIKPRVPTIPITMLMEIIPKSMVKE